MLKYFSEHPFVVANGAFALVALFGRRLLEWGAPDYAFLLMLYLVVVIGIRLDDIHQQMAAAKAARAEPQILEKLARTQASLEALSLKIEVLDERLKSLKKQE